MHPPLFSCRLVDEGAEMLGTLRSLTALNLQECWQATDRGLAHLSGERGAGGEGGWARAQP